MRLLLRPPVKPSQDSRETRLLCVALPWVAEIGSKSEPVTHPLEELRLVGLLTLVENINGTATEFFGEGRVHLGA